ncbi:unnamed protein product [Effrenium voratum]|uniref:Mitochondrial inner membrane protease subunit 2 n=1 Tax=Effrenium voratum TaxID=2562239 RepID=A0AA36J2X2_9DINO|nr:unnamed protein product [Effrenium voratum]CAJ1442782.1 unnamed protein product [Effrenium voratum]
MAQWRRFAKAAWIGLPPLLFVKDRWMWVYCVEGRSMTPTLNPQESFIDRCFRDFVLVHRNPELRKGDIVLLRDPGTNELIVKRLIAQEHEVVRTPNTGHLFVPEGHCWVEGDNGKLSVDSRAFGPVPAGLLEGLVLSVVWPIWRARWLEEDGPESPPLLTETGEDRMRVMVTSHLAPGAAIEEDEDDE